MSSVLTVRNIIDLWPSRGALVADIHVTHDPVTLATVHKWVQRNSIPARFHAAVLGAASRRGIDLSAEALVLAHDRRGQAA